MINTILFAQYLNYPMETYFFQSTTKQSGNMVQGTSLFVRASRYWRSSKYSLSEKSPAMGSFSLFVVFAEFQWMGICRRRYDGTIWREHILPKVRNFNTKRGRNKLLLLVCYLQYHVLMFHHAFNSFHKICCNLLSFIFIVLILLLNHELVLFRGQVLSAFLFFVFIKGNVGSICFRSTLYWTRYMKNKWIKIKNKVNVEWRWILECITTSNKGVVNE